MPAFRIPSTACGGEGFQSNVVVAAFGCNFRELGASQANTRYKAGQYHRVYRHSKAGAHDVPNQKSTIPPGTIQKNTTHRHVPGGQLHMVAHELLGWRRERASKSHFTATPSTGEVPKLTHLQKRSAFIFDRLSSIFSRDTLEDTFSVTVFQLAQGPVPFLYTL